MVRPRSPSRPSPNGSGWTVGLSDGGFPARRPYLPPSRSKPAGGATSGWWPTNRHKPARLGHPPLVATFSLWRGRRRTRRAACGHSRTGPPGWPGYDSGRVRLNRPPSVTPPPARSGKTCSTNRSQGRGGRVIRPIRRFLPRGVIRPFLPMIAQASWPHTGANNHRPLRSPCPGFHPDGSCAGNRKYRWQPDADWAGHRRFDKKPNHS